MRLVCISDTHRDEASVKVPDGDVLVYAGDIGCERSNLRFFTKFHYWMQRLPHKHKIVIPGNHDEWVQNNPTLAKDEWTAGHFLMNEAVEIDGVKFYGSPWTPEFCNWAFMAPRGSMMRAIWKHIPDDTEVLVTHGPPQGILDLGAHGPDPCGCEELMKRIGELKNLKAHIFGHIHGSYGHEVINNVHFVNASICTERYEPTNPPIVIDL